MLNILENTKCYLGGNLQNSENPEWKDLTKKKLKSLGVRSLDPVEINFINLNCEKDLGEDAENRNFYLNKRNNGELNDVHDFYKEIIRRDLRMIDLVDFTIFHLEPHLPTFGTIHEIVKASEQRKPIHLLMKNRKEIPLWICGLVNPNLIFETLDELFCYLEYLDNGKIELDTKYWKILKK